MNRYRYVLYGAVMMLSGVLALGSVFIYGKFQHDRYWHGTIERVSEVRISLMTGLFQLEGAGPFLIANQERLGEVFDPLRGRLAVDVTINNRVAYSNRIVSRSIKDTSVIQAQPDSEVIIRIDRYEPPTWGRNFISWLKRPGEWFTPRFNYITVPFLGLFAIYASLLMALVWRYRANHLSRDVLTVLNRIERSE